jgi:hypothetical protein
MSKPKPTRKKQQVDFYVLAPDGRKNLPETVLEAVKGKDVKYIRNFSERGLEQGVPTIIPSIGYVWGYGNRSAEESRRFNAWLDKDDW